MKKITDIHGNVSLGILKILKENGGAGEFWRV